MNVNEQHGTGDLVPREEGDQVPIQAPLGTGDFAGEFANSDPLAGSGGTRKLQGGSILIIAVVFIAVAGLFSMRKLAEITKGSGIDREIEATIEKILPSLGSSKDPGDPDAERNKRHEMYVMTVLGESYSERQVPLRDVQRNPFVISHPEIIDETNPPPPDGGTIDQDRWLREQQERVRKEVESAGNALALKAIMQGSDPIANVNGEMVRVGNTIVAPRGNIEFRVASIDNGIVRLVFEDESLHLTQEKNAAIWVLLTLRRSE